MTTSIETKKTILEAQIQQAGNAAFAAASLAKAYVKAGIAPEECKAKAEESSKWERVSLALEEDLKELTSIS